MSDILGVCPSTISYIKHSSNYEDYFQRLAAHNEKNRNAKKAKAQKAVDEEKKSKTAAQVIEHKQTIQVQATHYMMEEMKKTNEYLKLISNKLAFIVDELTK